ncbi:ferritin-like domain-containing protein [Mycolicibacillus trivialis]
MSDVEQAFCDALDVEHGVIYGYGMVSAHSPFDVNDLVAAAMREHRDRRDAVIALLGARGVDAPVAAAGYELPMPVTDPDQAAELAVRMENDAAAAWRAVLERAETDEDREFALAALTECAVTAARWNVVRGATPVTETFPGGSE